MPTTKTFNNTSYNIPLEGELNWATLSDFLVDIADNAQTTNKQKIATRVATATPVTVLAATDCVIISDLTVAGAVAVNLPAGVATQVFTVVDGKGDAGTNNITITPAAGLINGAATYVIDSNRAGVTLVYNGTGWTVIAEFVSSGDIPRNQIASGSANHVVINDGSGDLSSEAALAASRGGLATDASAFSGYVKSTAGVFSASVIAASDLPTLIDATKIADGSVTNTEFQYIGGVTSDVQTQIGTKVTGAASSTDNAIARFDLATGKIVQNSGVTIDDTNNVAGVVDITPTTINSVAMANYLTTTNAKVVTGKDIDGGTASNTSRLTVPKDTKANLEALTRKEATLVYASDLDKLYADDGTSLKEIGSGGSGINYLADYFTSDTLGTVGSGNVTDTGNRATGAVMAAWQSTNTANISLSVSATNPLRNLNNYLFTGAGNAAAGTTFVESPAFQLHIADLGKPITVSFDIADVTADGNFDVCMVRYDSSGVYQEKISIAGNASGATPASAKLPTGITKFNGFFIASSTATDYYALRFRRLAGTDVPRLDSNKISPDSVIQGAAITDWVSYTPTLSDATNATATKFAWCQVGQNVRVKGHVAWAGAGGGTSFGITLPTNALPDSSIYSLSGTDLPGFAAWNNSGTGFMNLTPYITASYVVFKETGTTNVWDGSQAASGDYLDFDISYAVVGWSSNVTMANRAVEEYASNNSGEGVSAGSTYSNTSYIVDGIAGSKFPNITATATTSGATSYIVDFNSSIQATDKIVVEVKAPGYSVWMDAALYFPPTKHNTTQYGIYFNIIDNTSLHVRFGKGGATASGAATYAAVGDAWSGYYSATDSASWYWRVRKVSGGASVGYPVSARNIIGDTTGTTVPSGYIGEKLSNAATGVALSGTAFATLTSKGITPGAWLIIGMAQLGVSANSGSIFTSLATATGGGSILLERKTLASTITGTKSEVLVWHYVTASSGTIYLQGQATSAVTGQADSADLILIRIA